MINRHQMIRVGLSLSLAFLAAKAVAQSKVDSSGSSSIISGDFNIGGQKKSVSGALEKFQEYRDVRDGFLLNDMRMRMESESKPYYLDFKVQNATRSDEAYKAKLGAYGKWGVAMSFDRTPHNFFQGTMILGGAGTGRLTIGNQVQVNLQASEQTRAERGAAGTGVNPRTDTTGEDALQQAIVRNLFSTTDPTVFKLERERSAAAMDFNVTPAVKTWVKVNQERRDGIQPIGTGTYERYSRGASGLTHTEDQFMVTGTELAEPIHYKTTTLNAGAGVYKKGWLADLEYTLTDFDNGNRLLKWGNPFRTTDLGAKSDVGANNNAYDRSRFVDGQMSLAPSSQSHDFALSGSVELPLHSRFTGNVSYGLVNQNELLAPYTLNSGIAGIGGAPANVTDAAALPVSRFNGSIRTLTQSYVLTTRPTEKLGASLKYRYYDYSNHSDSILFPGYAAYGESYWRTVKNAPSVAANSALVKNDPTSYVRQTAKLAVDYEVAHPLTIEADALWDRYNHKLQRIDSTNEVGAGAGFVYKPVTAASLKGSYHYAHRAVKNYKGGNSGANPEAIGLADFNWADRVRSRADLRADVSPVEAVSFGVAGQYQNDDYGAAERFGLKSQKNLVGLVDVTYEPSESFSLTANYSRERRKGLVQNAAKDDAFNVAGSALDDTLTGDNFNPFNYWNTDITENVNTIGLEATLRPVPEKLALNLGYEFSESRMRFDTSNPNAVDASAAGYSGAKLANGAAQVWPDVVNRLHEVRAGASYDLTKNLKVGLSYLFSWYKLNDFANNASYLTAAAGENTTKFVRTGNASYDYTAHLVGANLAYKF